MKKTALPISRLLESFAKYLSEDDINTAIILANTSTENTKKQLAKNTQAED